MKQPRGWGPGTSPGERPGTFLSVVPQGAWPCLVPNFWIPEHRDHEHPLSGPPHLRPSVKAAS